ncbi:MAG: DsbA family protein [Roseovarius sp.]
MTRLSLPALAASLCFALPLSAQALDISAMSDEERDAFRAEIRAYLLDNPQVIMEAVAVLEERDQAAQVQADVDLIKTNSDALFNDAASWSGGNPDGDVTLVEFMDYRCGFCRRAFDEVEQLIDIDDNIRIVIKEFPILGEESELSSRFAIATLQLVGDEAYKSVHDSLITFTGPMNETSLSRIADTLGLDAQPILDHMNSEAVTAVITDNRNLAQRMQISGTPSFVMGDQMLRGYLPLDGLLEVAEKVRAN